MSHSNDFHGLRVKTDAGQYPITRREQERMATDLATLKKVVADFPVSELQVEITQQSSGRVHVATSLRLPSRTLFTASHNDQMHPAWEHCLRKLVHKVTAYKERMSNKPTYSKENQGTLHNVRPSMEVERAGLDQAVQELDYPAFRSALAVYDDSLEARVGRWVERYPQVSRSLGDGLTIAEIVEEVYLNAFERYDERPPLRLGEWLESLIDPSIRTLVENSASERENLSFLETARQAIAGH